VAIGHRDRARFAKRALTPPEIQVGEFIARVRVADDARADVVDAHVALTTRATKSLVWTSDPKDMRRYGVHPTQIRRI
jgi:hypothetical protein